MNAFSKMKFDNLPFSAAAAVQQKIRNKDVGRRYYFVIEEITDAYFNVVLQAQPRFGKIFQY